MIKNINTVLFICALLIFSPVKSSLGQFIPDSSYKTVSVYAPDFSLKDLGDKVFRLNNQRGKPVLIFFGTTWCPSCRNELPFYKEIYETYTKRGLVIIYINIMESQGKVTKFAKANTLPFKVLLDEDGTVATNYTVVGVPTLVLIDKNGKIIKITHSTADLPLKNLLPVR